MTDEQRSRLRDEFAMAALTSAAQWYGGRAVHAEDIARDAYRIANAMLSEREKHQ